MITPGPVVPPPGYADWLVELKDRIRQTRLRVALAVNSELILLYWRIGRDILERQVRDGWGGSPAISGRSFQNPAVFPGRICST